MSDGPVDPTTTEAWTRLTALAEGLRPDLRAWFADDPGRVERFTFTAADLLLIRRGMTRCSTIVEE